jgi:ribosomal-protein-alanine N-acetyltransferase
VIRPPPPFNLRAMQVADIPRVMAIERDVFPSPWPAHAYRYELTQNALSHCYVLERADELVGYGCMWLVVDEAHISTLAVAPSQRGRGLGELLLLALLGEAIALDAVTATLEVRVSNQTAQALYAKYGFEVVGWRKRYYVDNQEDALIMTVEPLDQAYQGRLAALQTSLFERLAPAG